MDDLESVRVLNARDDLLEEAPCALFWHAAVGDDVVEELASGVFEDEDDVGRCGDDFISVWFANVRYSVNDSAAGKALDEQFDDMWVP